MTTPTLRSGESEALLERVVGHVFPEGTRIVEAGTPLATPYHVLSDWSGPRWLLPAEPRLGLPFLATWTAGPGSSFMRWAGVRLAYRLRCLDHVPRLLSLAQRLGRLGGRQRIEPLSVAIPRAGDWAHFGWRASSAPSAVVYVGFPDLTRKLVTGLVTPEDGSLCAVAKIALATGARRQVDNEGRVLARIVREHPGLSPELLYSDSGRGVVVLTPVAGRSTGRGLTTAHRRFLTALRRRGESVSLGERAAALAERLQPLAGGEWATDAATVSRALVRLDQAERLPAFWVHGDLAPRNLMRLADGRIVALDWEDAYPDGPPLQDLLYFLFHEAAFADPRRGLVALRRRVDVLHDMLDDLRIGRHWLEDLLRHFLAAEWIRLRERDPLLYGAVLKGLAACLRSLGPEG